ncbi:MAG: hypothetical protein E6R04_09680 [Spirochaetes bacterium]|nr:MAG: hypothetical protein E6R04_09680 [Spirochaetota bacterium]
MSDTVQIPVEVVLEDGSVKRSFIKIEREAEKAARNASKELEKNLDFGGITRSALKFTAALTAVGAGLAVLGFKKAIDEAREGERVINSFNAALFSTGNFTQSAASGFLGYAESLEKTLGVSKSVTLEGGKLLVTIGKLSGEGLERATKASLNLAAALGKDASTGFELISKAAAGNTEVLGRYGIKLDQNIPKNQRFAATLKLIEDRFGGLAEQSSNTLDGALSKLSLQFGNVFENLGQLVTNSPVIKKAISLLADGFAAVADKIAGFSQLSFDNLIIDALDFARVLSTIMLPAIEVILNIFGTLARTSKFVFDEMISRVSSFASGVGSVLNLVGLVSDETAASMKEVAAAAEVVATESAAAARNSFANILDTSTSAAINERIDAFVTKVSEAKGATTALKDQIISNNEQIKSSYISVGEAFSNVSAGIMESAAELAKNASANFKALGKAMLQGIGQAAGNAFASFGQAIVSGENALEAFGQSLLKAFGSSLIQLGTGFILQGVAQSLAGFGSGGPLIAAGAAMAAFGGILSASAGGGASVSGGGGVAAGGDFGGGVATSPGPATEIEDTVAQEPKPSVNIVVQGNILDRRNTGLELFEVLQEAIDTQGARVTGMV